MEGQRHWYVIHTYSGYENKVKLNLESKVHSLGMEDMIFQVLVPMAGRTRNQRRPAEGCEPQGIPRLRPD